MSEIERLARAHDAVDALAQQIDQPVALADLQSHAGMAIEEPRQLGQDERARGGR